MKIVRLLLIALIPFVALVAVSCGGGGGSSIANNPSPNPSGSPAPTPTAVVLDLGGVLGSDNVFADGDTASGGTGQTVDNIKCETMVTTYHVHAHLSIFVNGMRVAIPDTVGINNPGPESGGVVLTGGCFYHLHTHDADGYLHVEAPSPTAFTLGEFFDIWGEPLSSTTVANYSGTTRIYTAQAATPEYNAQTGPYTLYTGDPRAIALTSHEEIVLEVGPTFIDPPYIPPVIFYTQY